ncbi:MAG: hypothetical protein R3C14_20885 [Caldilineaceae bacterium]
MNEQSWKKNSGLWGILLILAGIFFLLQNFGILGALSTLIWSGLFTLGGLTFVYLFLTQREKAWWAAIPGFTLLGLATVILLDQWGPGFAQGLTGSVFLGSIGLGFVMVYLANSAMWWAIIPAGVMTTLAVVAGVDEIAPRGVDAGGIFFLGLGTTFLVLALLPQHNGVRLTWAFIPAAVLLVMGLLIGTNWINYMSLVGPIALIIGGGYWIFRNRIAHRQEDH